MDKDLLDLFTDEVIVMFQHIFDIINSFAAQYFYTDSDCEVINNEKILPKVQNQNPAETH